MKTNTTEGNLKSLIDSLKEKEDLLDLARARFDAAKIEDEYYIRTNKPAPNFGPARANLEALQSEVENLRFKVSQTDDEFRERAAIDAAPSALKQARKAMLAHQAELTSLRARKDLVVHRIDTLRREISTAQTSTDTEEDAARSAYAAAVANGDDQGTQAASSALIHAQEARQQAQQNAELQNGLVAALEKEVSRLDAQIVAAAAAERRERAAQFAALDVVISDEWNRAVGTLATLAARVTAVRLAQGGRFMALDPLEIPRLGKNKGALKVREVQLLAGTIDAESLLG